MELKTLFIHKELVLVPFLREIQYGNKVIMATEENRSNKPILFKNRM
jgi:hypothetical protein